MTAEGVTLSGAASQRGLLADDTLENPGLKPGAEGATPACRRISQAKGQSSVHTFRLARLIS